MVLVIEDVEDIKHIVMIYLMIMFLYIGKSAWEYFIYGRYTWRMGIARMGGIDITYGDPNAFAASIVYSLPFMWVLLKENTVKVFNRIFLIAYGLLCFLCIVYTGSRSGMLCALLFIFLALIKLKKKILGITVLVLSLILVWNIMPVSYQIRFESIFVKGVAEEAGQKGADESAEGRFEGLKQGIQVFIEHPLTGIGPGNFIYSWNMIHGFQAHNLYGQLLGELGLIGTVAFFWLILMMLFSHYRNRRTCDLWLSNTLGTEGNNCKVGIDNINKLSFLINISTASIQVILLLLFNGNFGHNLYRYNWLWIGAFAVCSKWSIDKIKLELN
jgi:O-antigen ligase